jgi:putative lipoic acid-binding regulatory protein
MKLLLTSLALVVFAGLVCTLDAAPGDNEKVPLDKLPKSVVDTVKAKFPKAVMKHAYKDTVDGKVIYEVGVDIEKTHLHAFVTAEGKLTEIHQEIDKKDVPEKVLKVVDTKYPKSKVEGVEKQTDPEGKVLGYEVTIEAADGSTVEVVVDPAAKIKKETVTKKAEKK